MANAQDTKNGGTQTPPPPAPPTAGEIAHAITKLVLELERFPADLQRRVLEGAATALGINRSQQPQRPPQRNNSGNRS